ncbi:MAG TPA: Rieske (2Fe-2S) protein [Candidatus Limnocylindria bacterium]|nr:Rieske (2Fe-2S) protein [Candidatus Limnocylindria bacterium]
MEPLVHQSLAEAIEELELLDSVADPLQQLAKSAVPEGSQLKDALSGTWLGHPLHPPLTDVVVGAWTSALLLDLIGGQDAEAGADALVAAGVVAAVPTALSGLSDWADVRGGSRRVGTVHALGNTTALVLHILSWFARRGGDRGRGRLLSASGFAVASFSAWLGGHLSFGLGVGVNQTAFDSAPEEWTPVLEADQLQDGALAAATAGTTPLLLLRRGEQVHALDDRCSHRGCLLHEGTLEGNTITCRCHGSTFRLDGSIVSGPATAPQPSFDARLTGGRVEIRARP